MNIEVSAQAGQTLAALARLSGCTVVQVVDRLLAEFGAPAHAGSGVAAPDAAPVPPPIATADGLPVFADYDGVRTHGIYDPQMQSITVHEGPVAGRYKSPTGAAKAIVSHYKPDVSPHRNGWTFWTLDDGSRRVLQSVREDGGR